MTSKLVLAGGLTALRPWVRADVPALVREANDPSVARFLGPGFPNPYLRSDAHDWVDFNRDAVPALNFVIETGGEFAGGIGLLPGEQIYAGSAMVGYWLGARFWGRGLASDALMTISRYGLDVLGMRRLWAGIMAPNGASARVLEKAGYLREACLRAAVIDRFGIAHDEVIFARLASDERAARSPSESKTFERAGANRVRTSIEAVEDGARSSSTHQKQDI